MSTADREKKRRVSYFVGLNDCDDSENENENDKNKKEQEEIYGWDLFRFIPLKAKTGSMVETRLYELCLQIIRVIAYASIFTIVIVSGVIAKTTILFAISQLERKDRLIYCEYNEYEKRSEIRQLLVNVPEEGRITWYWCVVLAFCTPEMLAVIGAIYDCLFKKKKLPYITDISIICITDGIHSAAMAVFFLVILPKLNSILALSVSSFMHLIPSLLGLLACCKFQRETKRKSIMKFIFKILLLVIQTGGVVLILLLSEIDNETCWILPCILLLCSLRWWPNYVTGKSDIGFIRYLNSVKERLKLCRGYEQGITAILRISTFFSASIVIVYYKNININTYLSCFPGRIKYNIILSSSINNRSDSPQNNITEETAAFITVDSSMLLVVLFSHALSSFVLYFAGKFAVKTLMQRFGFALPLSLVTSVSFIVMIIVCILRENNPCAFHGFIGDYLFFTIPKINALAASSLQWQCLLWLLILLSQVWTTAHIWTSHCERLATTHRIFALPFYDSLIIDQSLMLNRRKDNFLNHKKSNKDDHEQSRHDSENNVNASSWVSPNDQVTKIYACATMWHETEEEMMQFIGSILRLDICQSAMSFTQARYDVQIDDYFELECHIFFDDAFQCMYGCEGICTHDENETHVNDYVKSLMKVIKISVEMLGVCANPPIKYPAPYGGRFEWTLPGKTRLIVHLKDKNKIRHRKRWSQVMYMYYLLGYGIIDRPISINRKAVIAENTYILTLDGDIDFQPNAVKVLLHLMKRDKNLGAACGRIHPIGTGPMVWFQKFEYAIGHWLQKSTEHTIGSVLCSPGCFSLFRAKALMEDNVTRKYASQSTEAWHYIQYDQGEDRWLCTLVLQSGYRVEYSAASDSYTHAPETFKEFYNQRRRWIPSTIANIFDLLNSSKNTRKANENISWLYIAYQWILMGSTVLGPGTIFLMLVGAFVAAFRIDNWSSFYYNLIPIAIFVTICFICKSDFQLIVAAIISTFYGLVMIVVLVGIMLQIADDGWLAPSTILFMVVAGQLIIAGLLHPQEISCLICGVIYYVTVPSMYMLLIIYSLFNIHNVTWGTRESKVIVKEEIHQLQSKQNNKAINIQNLNNSNQQNLECSFLGLFRCIFGSHSNFCEQTYKLDNLQKSMDQISMRIRNLEKNLVDKEVQMNIPSKDVYYKNFIDVHEEQSPKKAEFNQDIDSQPLNLPTSIDNDANEIKLGNFLVSPPWVQDPDIQKGRVEFLSHEEEIFWNRLIKKYLYPLDEDKKQLQKTADALKNLRNEFLFKFFMLNALFVLTVFLMQLNKDTLHLQWPLGLSYNITYRSETIEVHFEKNYLQLEPIGCLFIIGFVLILFIQFIAMLFHRYNTFLHLLSNTSINLNCFLRSKNSSTDKLLEFHVKDMVKILQRLAEDNAVSNVAVLQSNNDRSPKKRKTVHTLLQNHEGQVKLPTDLETIFRKNLQESANESIDGNVFLELEKGDFEQMGIKMGPRVMLLKLLNKLRANVEIDKENFNTSSRQKCNETLPVDQNMSLVVAGTSAEKVLAEDKHQFSRYGTVVATLKAKSGGADLLKALRSDKIFDDKKRKALVRLVMSELVSHHDTHYPPEEAKIALAKALVTEFPRLKDSCYANGWTGFLEYRLYTMRSNLSPSKKMYSKAALRRKENKTHSVSSQFTTRLTETEITQKISVMKNCNPSNQNKEKIMTLLEETRHYRRQWIEQSSPTISEIFSEYPRLLDYDGEMIEQEFNSLYPKSADNFLKQFPTFYAPRIYYFVKQCKPTLYSESAFITDENLRALLILCALLPVSNSVITKKGKGKGKGTKRKREESNENSEPLKTNTFPNRDLLKVVADGMNLTNYVDDLKKRQVTNIQPYLISVKGQDTDTFFVEGDNWFINMNQKSTPIAAFNLLYKLFYVLNVKYSENLQNFYNFIDCYIFAMEGVQPRSSVSSLHVVFNNTVLNDNIDDSTSSD